MCKVTVYFDEDEYVIKDVLECKDLIDSIEKLTHTCKQDLQFLDTTVQPNVVKFLSEDNLPDGLEELKVLQIFKIRNRGTKYTTNGPEENWIVPSPQYYSNKDKLFIRRTHKGNDFVVHFVPFEQNKNDSIFVELPFKLTQEEIQCLQKTNSNASSNIPFNFQENQKHTTTDVLRQAKEAVEPLIQRLVCSVYEEEYNFHAEEEMVLAKKRLRIHGENDDRVHLKLLISFVESTNNSLNSWLPMINILSSILLRTHHLSYSDVRCIQYHQFFRYIEIWQFFIDLLQNSIVQSFSSKEEFLDTAKQGKEKLIALKNNFANDLLHNLERRILSNSISSFVEFGQPSLGIESITQLKWKSVGCENIDLSLQTLYFFIPEEETRATEVLSKVNHCVGLQSPHQSIIVCCRQVLFLEQTYDEFYPFSVHDISKHLQLLEKEKVSFPNGSHSSNYLKSYSKADFMKYAEYLQEEAQILDFDQLNNELKLFCKRAIPISKSLIEMNYFIKTSTMHSLRKDVSNLAQSTKSFQEIIVSHYPSMGGTTTARVLAFSTHENLPLLLLNETFCFTTEFTSIVTEITRICLSAVVIIADNIGEREYKDLKEWAKLKRIILVKFQRVESKSTSKYFIDKLSVNEKRQFVTLFKTLRTSEQVAEDEIGFLYLGLVYLHEEYRLKYQLIFKDQLCSANSHIQKVFHILSLIRIFAKNVDCVSLTVLMPLLGITTTEEFNYIFTKKEWFKQFFKCTQTSIDISHRLLAELVLSTLSNQRIISILHSIINMGTINQIIENMICHVKQERFSFLIEHLQRNAESLFEEALQLNNIYCNTQYCKWLAFYDSENSIEKIECIINITDKIPIQSAETQSTVYCSHGDTYRYIYGKRRLDDDAIASIQFYHYALAKNKKNCHASLGLSKIVLKFLSFNSFSPDAVQKIETKIRKNPLQYLFNIYIQLKLKNSNVHHYIFPFISEFEDLFFKFNPEYISYLSLAQEIPNCEEFELLEKWNHLVKFSQSLTYAISNIPNNEDVIFASYIELVMRLVQYLNGNCDISQATLAYQNLKLILEDAVLPITYFFPNEENFCRCSAPEFLKSIKVERDHFSKKKHMQIFQLLEKVSFTNFSSEGNTGMSLHIDEKGDIIYKVC